MEISQVQRDLIDIFKYLKIDTETIVFIMMACQEQALAQQMMEYIVYMDDNKEKITAQMLVNKVAEIIKN